jgi:C4-dicarboxylate-binding protein DctP
MRTKLTVLLLALTLALAGAFSSASPAAAVEIKIAHENAKTHPVGVGFEAFKVQVEKASKGKIKVKAFHAAALGGAGDNIQGVQLGNIQMGSATCGELVTFCPEFNLMSLPFVFRDERHLHKMMDGELGQVLTKAAKDKVGLEILGYSTGGIRQIETRKEVKKADDMKGLKIRTMNVPGIIEVFKLFGSIPTPISFGEVYTALQSGVVDGCETSFISWIKSKLYEVAKYGIEVNYMDTGRAFYANPKFMAKLSKADHKIVTDAMKSAVELIRKEYIDQQIGIIAKAKELGGVIVKPDMDSFRKAASPIYDKFKPALGKEWLKKISEN